MIDPNETFSGSFPFAPNFSDAPGYRMHYIDIGHRDGEVVLCLHGEPTWGYLYRNLAPVLATTHRVVVPDHMGFGKSATPSDRTYWLQDHIDNLERFVIALDLRNITLVMHDFGGPVGMGMAARHPDRIRRLVAANAPTPLGQPDLSERLAANVAVSPWFQWIIKAENEGHLEAVLGHLGFNILSTLKLNGFENNNLIDETWLGAYAAHFSSPAECLGAIGWAKGLATGMHRFEAPDELARRAIRNKPALALWGGKDRTLGAQYFLPLFTQLFPAAPVHQLSHAGHYCLEDAPGTIAGIVADFIRST